MIFDEDLLNLSLTCKLLRGKDHLDGAVQVAAREVVRQVENGIDRELSDDYVSHLHKCLCVYGDCKRLRLPTGKRCEFHCKKWGRARPKRRVMKTGWSWMSKKKRAKKNLAWAKFRDKLNASIKKRAAEIAKDRMKAAVIEHGKKGLP